MEREGRKKEGENEERERERGGGRMGIFYHG